MALIVGHHLVLDNTLLLNSIINILDVSPFHFVTCHFKEKGECCY